MNKDSAAYTISVDQINKTQWEELLHEFADATIYQSWSYGAVRWGQKNLSHIVLKQKDEIIGAAQLRIIKIPLLNVGIAYVTWGPLWRRRNRNTNIVIFRHVIKALKEEYVIKQGLLLRIRPNIFIENGGDFISILNQAGFKRNEHAPPYRTLILDLSATEIDIRKAFDQKWRNQLNCSEKNNLIILEGTSDDLYQKFLILQKEMYDRKKYMTGIDYNEFRNIQKDLPEQLKMIILICEYEGKALTATIGSMIGETGIYLLGATGNDGMKMKGAYLLQWHFIEMMKKRGCKLYDLGGIDPDGNPGVYHFKSGISHQVSCHIGQFEVSPGKLSKLIVDNAEELKSLRIKLNKHLHCEITMNLGKR